jgi:hypothetical protein
MCIINSRLSNLISIVCVLISAASSALADSIPGFLDGPYAYYSTDMNPVEVSFASIKSDDTTGTYKTGHLDSVTKEFVQGAPMTTAILPRAFINAFVPYSSKKTWHRDFQVRVLPSKIVGNNLIMAMTYPDSLPYSVVYETWPKYKPDLSLPGMGQGVIKWDDHKALTRAMLVTAKLSATPFGNAREFGCLQPMRCGGKLFVGDYQGFKHYRDPDGMGTGHYYFDNGSDDIRAIKCFGTFNDTPPGHFCTYSLAMNPSIFAELTFLDFRMHGGRPFVRDRIRVFKKFACPIFQCDEKALKAAEIEELR